MMRLIKIIALVLPAFLPLSGQAQILTHVCTTVPSASPAGVAIGEVVAGTTYSYTASGCIHHNTDPAGVCCRISNADSQSYLDLNCSQPCSCDYGPPPYLTKVCPNMKPFSLVGKIAGGNCTQLGTAGTFTAAASGQLVVVFNDDIFGDNSGSFDVCITDTTSSPTSSVSACLPATLPAQHAFDVTRTALFWFTHPETNNPACATLYQAIAQNAQALPIGFLCLPTTYRSTNYVLGAEDALIEALGLYWRGVNVTGEDRGLQTQRSPASLLCRARKQLAVELIAAIANNVLLGTSPTNASYKIGKVVTNFPADLIDQAGQAIASEDRIAIVGMTALLKKFNASGVTNQFNGGWVECSPWPRKILRSYGQDPTTKLNCPGLNDTCETAESVLFPVPTSIFSPAVFTRTVDLRQYTTVVSNFFSSACLVGGIGTNGAGSSGTGTNGSSATGNGAVWKITPAVGTAGRRFTVSTFGSNVGTVLSVWSGSCSNWTEVNCTNNTSLFVRSPMIFNTDGVNNFYIVGQGNNGSFGRLKLRITSP